MIDGCVHQPRPRLPPRPRPATATRFPIGSSGISPDLSRLGRVAGRLRRARPEDRRVRRAAGHAGAAAPDALLAALQASRRHRAARIQGLVFRGALCYDQDQRDNQINARRQQVQILFAKAAQAAAWFDPELLSDSARRRCAAWIAAQRGPGGLPLRDRRSLPPAGTCARRQGRASAVAGEPVRVDAERRLRGAVHRRRQVSRRSVCRTARK